jgi:putative ABC transport system permease protein
MRTLWQDVHYGLRTLFRTPSFTLVAVITLALGIGANTAIFSVVNSVLLRPLPFADAERIVTVWSTSITRGTMKNNVSYLNFKDWQEQNRVFSHIAAYSGAGGILTGGDAPPEQLNGAAVTGNIFALLGTPPALGRTFTPEEEKPDAAHATIISHSLWQRRFNSDSQIVGKQIVLDNNGATVVGVMPAGFQFFYGETKPDFFVPVSAGEELNEERGAGYLHVLARLKDGVTIEQAQAEMDVIASRLAEQYPEENAKEGVSLVPLYDDTFGEVKPALLVLLGAVGFVLLIACANVANLLLTRATRRSREIAIRTALGATRGRVVRQLLTESLLLSAFGGVLGLLLAWWGVDLLAASIPADVPRASEINLDGRVLLFTLTVSALTGIIFGFAPALQASKTNLSESLKEGGRTATGGIRRARLRSLLVVSEVALSLVLLVGAGLLIKSFLTLREVKPGFQADGVLTAIVSLPEGKYEDELQQTTFFQQALERTSTLPGVEAIGAVFPLPLSGNNMRGSFAVESRPPAQGETPVGDFYIITPDYTRAMGIPLLKGRTFTERDNDDAPKVLLISETLARRYFPDEDPIGKRLSVAMIGGQLSCEIVGVVGDVKHSGLDAHPTPQYYFSYGQAPMAEMTLVARTNADDPTRLAPTLRAGVQEVDKDQPIAEINALNRLVADSVARQRFQMLLLVLFATVALTLAAVGIFSVMNFTVAGRTHEIGVRMALGAQRADVLRLVIGQGMMLVALGVALGLVGSFAIMRVMASQLYGVSATDPVTFAWVAILLTMTALLACYIPARKATMVDPMVALHYE